MTTVPASARVEDVRSIFRALADVRNGQFQTLMAEFHLRDLTHPKLTFSIRQFAEVTDAGAILGVDGTRKDGIDILFSVAVRVSSLLLTVSGQVELTGDAGYYSEPFFVSGDTEDPVHAAGLIARFAEEVSEQTAWLD